MSMSQKDLTVMFSDIKNFTRKVEEMTPNQLSSMLSDYLNTMCSAISMSSHSPLLPAFSKSSRFILFHLFFLLFFFWKLQLLMHAFS